MRTSDTPPRFTIGGADIGMCLTRLHHDRFTDAQPVPDPVRQRLIDRGYAFDRRIKIELTRTFTGTTATIDGFGPDAIKQTMEAIRTETDLIVDARIVSPDERLVGAPDLLVRLDDGYAPVEIKSHKVLTTSGLPVRLAPMDAIAAGLDSEGHGFRSHRKRDLLQLAHYWRILDSHGVASSLPTGGVIGTDELDSEIAGCVWVDLATDQRDVLTEASDYIDRAVTTLEHGTTNSDPLVAPWWRGACKACPWKTVCLATLTESDDPTLLTGIGETERVDLAAAGVHTVADVAGLDIGDDIVEDGSVILTARARVAGHLLRRQPVDAPLELPTNHLEVDFDIETFDGRIYLAGFLVTDRSSGTEVFDPIVDWEGTDQSEHRFITAMFDRLAHYAARDATVLHWTGYEPDQLARAADKFGLSIGGYETVSEWFDHHAVDLYAWTKSTFVAPDGFGLKAVAPLCGFDWRDEDPGGLQSELWYAAQLAGDRRIRTRILAYNEDDVRAQLAIREWIRHQPPAAIPSALSRPIPPRVPPA